MYTYHCLSHQASSSASVIGRRAGLGFGVSINAQKLRSAAIIVRNILSASILVKAQYNRVFAEKFNLLSWPRKS